MNYHHLTIEERCCIREYYKKVKPTEKLQDYWVETLELFRVS